MVISTLLKNGTVKFLKNLHIGLIAKKLFFQIKILNDNNFFLVIINILVKFKMFIYSPWKFLWSTNIQNALPLVYWPPHGIAIDHSSIGLKRLTIQLVFNEAWLCVVLRFLRHNTCTATLSPVSFFLACVTSRLSYPFIGGSWKYLIYCPKFGQWTQGDVRFMLTSHQSDSSLLHITFCISSIQQCRMLINLKKHKVMLNHSVAWLHLVARNEHCHTKKKYNIEDRMDEWE